MEIQTSVLIGIAIQCAEKRLKPGWTLTSPWQSEPRDLSKGNQGSEWQVTFETEGPITDPMDTSFKPETGRITVLLSQTGAHAING